ncbi:DNA circularization protein [Paraburkholderia mimosarum]|uniref:DNA circularization protein n=1 Tax=Paraburkholderia mimosarum TaxID=312026 RepID=UPI00041482EC|nr:DNA circularization N-terminal domain-containing protein [Paraburkholderia mimosarum]
MAISLSPAPYFGALQRASWRGVPFATRGGTVKVGRRVALHEYPFRDDVWVEDLGRAGRRISLTGFLVQDAAYGGGDVISQRTAMIQACETEDKGDGELVHPSLGRLTVSLLDFECEESAEHGRAFEVRFTFITAGQQQFPTLAIATRAQTGLSALAAFAASAQDFMTQISSYLTVPPLVGELERTAQGFVNEALSIVTRATNLVSMVATLPGQFGRYVGEFTAGVKNPYTTMEQLYGRVAQAHEAAAQAGSALTSAAAVANYPAMASAAQALVGAVQSANPDPHQAVQSLIALQQATVPQQRASANLTSANAISTALYRQSAVIALGDTTAGYALSSYDDAQTLRSTVSQALDTEIVAASDSGSDATYQALQTLQTAVVKDLVKRGDTLATLQPVFTAGSMPLLVMAYRLYQDVGQYDALVHQVNPVNPAFAPVTFSAALR